MLQKPDHYFYEPPDKANLCQGDVLERSQDLLALLSDVHPHYSKNESYGYFVVVTQTCDLVCRDGCPPTSPYITIAAARPIEEAIIREAKRYQEWWENVKGLLDSKGFDQMVLFTESLLNNNAQNYFYLPEDLNLGISGQHCAFLALAITLKIDHYKICQEAKVAQIKEVFRAKLGWLIGNMYSRVGTPDRDDYYGKNTSRKEASQLIQSNFAKINKDVKDRAIKELSAKKDLKTCSPEEIWEQVQSTSTDPREKRFSDRLKKLFVEKIMFVGSIGGRLTQDLVKDKALATEIQRALQNCDSNQTEATVNEITAVLTKHLRIYLKDDAYPGREKLARKIMENIKQDSIIKNILA